MGLLSKLRKRIRSAVKRAKTRAVSTVRKLRSGSKKIVRSTKYAGSRIVRTLRKQRSRIRDIYETADVSLGGYLPGGASVTQSKFRRLRKKTKERTILAQEQDKSRDLERDMELQAKQDAAQLEIDLARIRAETAEYIDPYLIREDLATRGFLEIPSAAERALRSAKESQIASAALGEFEDLAGGAVSTLFAPKVSDFAEDVKKAGLGIGAVLIGVVALIGISKIKK